MGQPTALDVHAGRGADRLFHRLCAGPENFVAGDSMPWFPVEHKSDLYFVFNKNDWMRDDAVKVRAEGERAPRSGFTLSKNSYNATPWWTAVPLSQLTTANADPSVQLDRAATQLVTQRMLIRRERIYATKFMTTGLWGTSWRAVRISRRGMTTAPTRKRTSIRRRTWWRNPPASCRIA